MFVLLVLVCMYDVCLTVRTHAYHSNYVEVREQGSRVSI